MRRLVSFLGLGPPKSLPPHYMPTQYGWNGSVSIKTPLVERAICELMGPFESIVVLGTPEVKARWIDTGLLVEHLGVQPQFEEFHWDSDGADPWAIFSQVRKALSRDAVVEWGEESAPTEIVLDVTHGFRAQPLLGLAALNFTLSEWAQQPESKVPAVRLVYGAFEASRDGVAPLWDLTQFVAVSQWNDAIQALVRFGRADDLERLGLRESQAIRAAAPTEPRDVAAQKRAGIAQRFGKIARLFADDLALARFPALIETEQQGSVAQLRFFLASDDRRELIKQLPLLSSALLQLDAMVAPLRAGRLESAAGVTALSHLAELYGRLHRFSEQVAVVREAAITAIGVAAERAPTAPIGTEAYGKARGELEDFSQALGKSRQTVFEQHKTDAERAAAMSAVLDEKGVPQSPRVLGGVELFSDVYGPRNDIHHGGLGSSPSTADRLRAKVDGVTRDFVAMVRRA